MKLSKFYELAVKFGLQNDLRTKKEIGEDIRKSKKMFNKLTSEEKKYFDKELLRHPYSDTRILYGDPDAEIKTVIAGIDMEAPELVLADRLREKGLPIDLVLSHHPEGKALSGLTGVMRLQEDMLCRLGLKRDIAKNINDERISEVSRSLLATNHDRAVSVAKLLDIPFMCAHTVADNHVANYLQKMFDKEKPVKVKDVMKMLRTIPEYRFAMQISNGPALIAGKENDKAGKIFVDMTGGTEGSKKVFARLSQAGVGTIVGMHFSEGHYSNAKSENINLIVAGHISSDNLGMNLLLDNIEKTEALNIIACSGFRRVKRDK